MISRLSKWLSSYRGEEVTGNPTLQLNSFIDELRLAYQDCQNSLKEAYDNQHDLMKNYEKLISEQKEYENEALKEANRQHDEKSKFYAMRSASLEDPISDYKRLLTEVCSTIYSLEQQSAKLMLNIDKANSKHLIATAKLKNAQNKLKVSEELFTIENSDELKEIEETILDAEAKAEALAYLNGESTDSKDDFDAQENVDQIIKERSDVKSSETRHRMKVTLGRVFTNDQPEVNQRFKQAVRDKLEAFRSDEAVETNLKVKDLNTFFKEGNELDDKRVNTFFEGDENDIESSKKVLVDVFFEESQESLKSKKINDFFSD